ncbi:MAG: sulfurtransferase-like selenium metabolism protein YedF [bacterium]
MQIKFIDVRGVPCPTPVIMTKQVIKEGLKNIEVLSDNRTSVENIKRLAVNEGYSYKVIENPDETILLKLEKEEKLVKEEKEFNINTVILIDSDKIGKGDEELGKILMKSFLECIKTTDKVISRMILIHSAVRLTTVWMEFVELLKEIEKKGIEILVCGICLDFYNLKNDLKVGRVTNFFEVTEILLSKDRIIKI